MDQFIISARPQPYDVSPYKITLSQVLSSIPEILITGRSFLNITNVYLSSDPTNQNFQGCTFSSPIVYVNPFSKISNLSANNPGFSGVDISDYLVVLNENYIVLDIPNIFTNDGYFDIVIQNEAGFGILSQDSRLISNDIINPDNLQKPCVNGIEVIML